MSMENEQKSIEDRTLPDPHVPTRPSRPPGPPPSFVQQEYCINVVRGVCE